MGNQSEIKPRIAQVGLRPDRAAKDREVKRGRYWLIKSAADLKACWDVLGAAVKQMVF